MARKAIRRAECEDFDIIENGGMVGTIRVKPSGILWRAKGKQSWMGVTVEQFAAFADTTGRRQSK